MRHSADARAVLVAQAAALLRTDPRVDRRSLHDRVRRIRNDRLRDARRAEDVGAELRFAAFLLLGVADLERVTFAEAPDVRATVAGEAIAFEVMRLRRPEQDDAADEAIERARPTGLLAVVSADPAEAQGFVESRIAAKASTVAPGVGLVVVSDSEWRFGGDLVACAARRMRVEHALGRGPSPFGVTVAWDTRGPRRLECVRGPVELLTPALARTVEALPLPVAWW